MTGAGTVVSEREDNAALGATLEARRWRSFTRIRLAVEYKGDRYLADPAQPLASVCVGCVTRDEVGGSATLSLGHLVSAPLAIAPDHGTLLTAVARRREQQGSPRWTNEVLGRLLWYARAPGVGGFAHSVFALRAAAGGRAGPIAETFGVGGVSSGVFTLGLGPTLGGTRFFPVRGYAGSSVNGRRAATVSLEYRVPLALVGHEPWMGELASLLLSGSPTRLGIDFAKSGVMGIEVSALEPAAGRLRFYLTPQVC